MSKMDKKYSNAEITVFWKPDLCIHSRKCFTSLIAVFNPGKRPWIDMSGADTRSIIDTVTNCPSGALSYRRLDEPEPEHTLPGSKETVRISLQANGPIQVKGSCIMTDKEGKEYQQEGPFFLCRCGASQRKPFCDGSHLKINFQD